MVNLGSEIRFESGGKYILHVGTHSALAIRSAAKRMGPDTKVWILTSISPYSVMSTYTGLAQDIVSGELVFTGETIQLDSSKLDH